MDCVLNFSLISVLCIHANIFFYEMTGQFVIVVLLDLTWAYDTVDHSIFLSWLELCVGIKGEALDNSFLFSDRSFSRNVGNFFQLSSSFLWDSMRLNSWATSVSNVSASSGVCSEKKWFVLALSYQWLSDPPALKTY